MQAWKSQQLLFVRETPVVNNLATMSNSAEWFISTIREKWFINTLGETHPSPPVRPPKQTHDSVGRTRVWSTHAYTLLLPWTFNQVEAKVRHQTLFSLSLSLSISLSLVHTQRLLPVHTATRNTLHVNIYTPAAWDRVIHVSIYLSFHLFIYLHLQICKSTSISISISIYLSTHLSIDIYLSMSIYLSIYLYLIIHLSIYLFIYIYLSISIYVYLSISIHLSLSIYIHLSIYTCLQPCKNHVNIS